MIQMSQSNPDAVRLYSSTDDRLKWQLKELQATVEHARNSKYYRNRFEGVTINTMQDLQKLPVTRKEDVREQSPFGLLCTDKKSLFDYHESFGTTGEPVSVWLTKHDYEKMGRQLNQSGLNLSSTDTVLVRFPYAISLPAHMTAIAAQLRNACVIPASSRTFISPHSRIIKLLQKLECSVLGSMPMEAVFLSETAKLMGFDSRKDFPHLRGLSVAGEMLSKARKKRIASLWDAEVYNNYGTTELCCVANDCQAGNMHAAEDHHIFEVLNPVTLEPVGEGEIGKMFITTLGREAVPFFRYDSGDWVKMVSGETCGCGRTSAIIEHYGRDINGFTYNQRWIFSREIEEIVLEQPEEEIGNFYLIIIDDESVTMRVESREGNQAAADELAQLVSEQLRIPFVMELVNEGTLFDRNQLMEVSPVIKPRFIVDWRNSAFKPRTLSEILSGLHSVRD